MDMPDIPRLMLLLVVGFFGITALLDKVVNPWLKKHVVADYPERPSRERITYLNEALREYDPQPGDKVRFSAGGTMTIDRPSTGAQWNIEL
jgi:hypothetical protein